MTNKLNEILVSWGAERNVLLYGPPATGKTRLISQLFQALNVATESSRGILLDPSNIESPFSRPQREITIPQPVKVVWTTFHQSYGYEDFVLGLRPEITAEGTHLQPHAGIFLDAALELTDPLSMYKSVVIFIDEINRGNAARIFGEFMTFLDFDYREEGRFPIPLPLRQVMYKDGLSERISRPNGNKIQIPENFMFPKHVYIVSTMNSVDRAAIPIDSALARRFDRIEMRPDLNALARYWGLDERNAIPRLSEDIWETLNPFVTGYLLLDRLNVVIASDLGSEFELGHGLLTSVLANRIIESDKIQSVEENDAWQSLAETWDNVLFPQLEDRYSGRPEQLLELLHVDTPPVGDYAWTLRTSISSGASTRVLAPVRVSELEISVIKRSFRWLTH
ncbi:AAA family ATPase [Providencia rettgeri]|uniref:AAA family ATPase n=1 Tax=Providencia rettgeri TaxID=587 RepID=UPI001CA71A7F|nr:AAA family ATPase [Providencia rettgeri]